MPFPSALKNRTQTTGLWFLKGCQNDHLNCTRDAEALRHTDLIEQLPRDSFGNNAGSARTRYGYTGCERDSDTGLLFYRARWSDPQQGRFTSEDPIGFEGGDINLYGYVANHPIDDSDPLGLQGRAGRSGRGNYKADFKTRCNSSQDCDTIARNMAALARVFA